MTAKRDYYEILGVGRDANTDRIRKAYRGLAREYHPDVNKSPDAEERFKEINEAYEVLCDQEKRAAYDRFGHAGVEGKIGGFSGFPDFDDIFESFFGGFAGPRTQRGPRPGEDLRASLTLSFEEAVFGADKELDLQRLARCQACGGSGAEPGSQPMRCPECGGTGQVRRVRSSIFSSFINVATCSTCQGKGEVISDPCHKCHGQQRVRSSKRLQVTIPPGVDDGTRIRLAGEGNAGIDGGPPGHLYVFLTVKPHRYFKRKDNNIHLNLTINVAQAALGDEISVPTLDGDAELKIPAGTQTGQTFALKGKGVPYLRRNGRGDQLVTVFVATPTKLSSEQKQLLLELSKTLGAEPIPQEERGLFDRLKDAFGL
ncbi:MAG: molecular chaperone DnaJ [Anaerolineae bacterium SM23_84]|nr:MAG: molecular chaperone DnaJ [Anaerolineae bacterium SM23_84]